MAQESARQDDPKYLRIRVEGILGKGRGERGRVATGAVMTGDSLRVARSRLAAALSQFLLSVNDGGDGAVELVLAEGAREILRGESNASGEVLDRVA